MTKKWFLVEEANRNLSIGMLCADAIYAINQLSGEPQWSIEKIESSIENGRKFLSELSTAIESLYRDDIQSDPFMFSLADETAKFLLIRPKQLVELTQEAISDLTKKTLSLESYNLLTTIIKITQKAAVLKCESIKPLIL